MERVEASHGSLNLLIGLVIAQGLAAALGALFLYFSWMYAAACSPSCDSATAYEITVGYVILSGVVLAAAISGVILARRRNARAAWIPATGLVITIASAAIAHRWILTVFGVAG